ncbi:MAG: response regulator [Desulfobacter sp.]|nr:MAG: response regulator [Desulfobacter sp.]
MKILVIDDEKPTLAMFKFFLAAYGYEVYTAENGEEGMDLFQDLNPDMVFTDIRMPGMDGLEVLRQIRAARPQCQVIIITGHGDMDRALEALDLDASDFINKPVERQALNEALVRAEKRAKRISPQEFCLEFARKKAGLTIGVKGRGAKHIGTKLAEATSGLNKGDIIEFDFHPEFSIDRQGLYQFTDFLQVTGEQGIKIRIKGLSYNYIRFFEMAGIHNLAELLPGKPQEPEF